MKIWAKVMQGDKIKNDVIYEFWQFIGKIAKKLYCDKSKNFGA